jgi:hypothetical protein
MSQQPPWQPQHPSNNQPQWQQQPPLHPQSFYNQPTQATPGQSPQPSYNNFPPPRKPGLWQWYKSRTKKVKLSIGYGTILAVLLFFSCIGIAVGSVHLATQSTPTPTTTNNQAAKPVSPTATQIPSPSPTSTQKLAPISTESTGVGTNPTYGLIAIGEPISNFVGKYGLPSVNQDIDVEFNSAGYVVSVLPDFQDGISYKDRALTVAAYAPKESLWNPQQAQNICTQFVPNDAKLQKTIPQVDNGGNTYGIDYLYFSTSLISKFKPAQFIDQQQNPTTPGFLNVVYWIDPSTSSGISECLVEPGTDVANG